MDTPDADPCRGVVKKGEMQVDEVNAIQEIVKALGNLSMGGLIAVFVWQQLSWYRKVTEDMITWLKEQAERRAESDQKVQQ